MEPRSRRELTLAVLLCLLGAFVVLVAAGRVWTEVEVAESALAPARTVGALGTEVVPGLRALGLVALAGVVALAATRRVGRTVVGIVLAVVGAVVVVTSLTADGAQEANRKAAEGGGQVGDVILPTGWPNVAVLGGLLVVAAGLLVAARGRRWAALSRKYEPPTARTAEPAQDGPVAERALWEALDRGEDPTAR